jgi:hypothetical protein
MAARKKCAVAQSDWAPTSDLDAGRYLSFRKGEIIEVAEEREPGGWWGGRLADGREGWFPSSFCRVVSDSRPSGTNGLVSVDTKPSEQVWSDIQQLMPAAAIAAAAAPPVVPPVVPPAGHVDLLDIFEPAGPSTAAAPIVPPVVPPVPPVVPPAASTSNAPLDIFEPPAAVGGAGAAADFFSCGAIAAALSCAGSAAGPAAGPAAPPSFEAALAMPPRRRIAATGCACARAADWPRAAWSQA